MVENLVLMKDVKMVDEKAVRREKIKAASKGVKMVALWVAK